MKIIEIDGKSWKQIEDYITALRTALGCPEWHGGGIDAFIDSMVYGGINKENPPYTIRIINTENLDKVILSEMYALRKALPRHGAASNNGADITIEIIP